MSEIKDPELGVLPIFDENISDEDRAKKEAEIEAKIAEVEQGQ